MKNRILIALIFLSAFIGTNAQVNPRTIPMKSAASLSDTIIVQSGTTQSLKVSELSKVIADTSKLTSVASRNKLGDSLKALISSNTNNIATNTASITSNTTNLSKLTLSPTAEKTSAYTAVAGDIVKVNATNASVPVTLSTGVADGSRVIVKVVALGTGNTVPIYTTAPDVFNRPSGPTTIILSVLNQGYTFQYDATNHIWIAINTDTPLPGVIQKVRGLQATDNYVGSRIINGDGQNGFPTSAADYTWSLQVAIPSGFTAIRPIFANNLTSALVNVKYSVSVGATASDRLNSSGTWIDGTWNNGASTGTVPASTGTVPQQVPYLYTPDWVNIEDVARGDGGTFPLAYIRVVVPGASNTTWPMIGVGNNSGRSSADWETPADGMIWALRYQAGDFIATKTTMNSTSNPLNGMIVGVQFMSKTKIVSVYGAGNSITVGYSSTPIMNSWLHRAVTTKSTTAAPFVLANWAASGKNTQNFLERAVQAIPILKPVVAFYEAFTPNYTPSTTFNTYMKSHLRQFLEVCRNNGVIPVLWTGMPRTTDATNTTPYWTLTQDNLRKTMNADILSYGGYTIDYGTIMADQNGTSTQSLWGSASWTADGVHPNYTGEGVMVPYAVSVLNNF